MALPACSNSCPRRSQPEPSTTPSNGITPASTTKAKFIRTEPGSLIMRALLSYSTSSRTAHCKGRSGVQMGCNAAS
ncbi:hypothetical protein JCM14635_22900 [Megalodesulfovibrio paquesii]